jgi:hypothetical protein
MTDDQRFAARRPDVLVYETEILKDMTLAGDISNCRFQRQNGCRLKSKCHETKSNPNENHNGTKRGDARSF